MATAAYPVSAYRGRPTFRSRLSAFLLALVIVAALIVALIGLGYIPITDPGDGKPLSIFDVAGQGERVTTTQRSKVAAAPRATRATTTATRRRTPPPVPTPEPAPPIEWPKEIMLLSRDQFASADVGKMERAAGAPTQGGGAARGAGDSPFEEGAGPGGARLYGAEWVREPTRAELAFYLPKTRESGWGLIACRTAPRNRVVDCQVLGESPGSGIARGVREAAWQFQVRPPREGGKPMIGVWVRIKFDLTVGVVN